MPASAFILNDTFGCDSFCPNQRQVIDNVLARKNALAVMPTGGGKSLCYQIPGAAVPRADCGSLTSRLAQDGVDLKLHQEDMPSLEGLRRWLVQTVVTGEQGVYFVPFV